MSKEDKEYFNAKELAQLAGVSTQRIRQLAKEGKIPGISKRFGRDWVIPVDKAAEWLARRQG